MSDQVRGLTISSRLAAPADAVWARACTLAGVNAELGPWLRMGVPSGLPGPDATLRAGALGRSTIRLLGVVPVDADDIVIDALGPGRRFAERSTLLSARRWEHDREVTDAPGGCTVTDRVAFTPRVAVLGGVQALAYRAVFRWRHRRLRRHWRPA